MEKSKRDRRVVLRRLGAVLVIALPVFFFLPGIGFDATHPASLARQNGPSDIWLYRVRKDNTLSKIAERELGTLHRYGEILALNPGVKPRALTLGSVLRMPPRNPQATRPAESTIPAVAAGPSPRRLLIAFAALLALVIVVVAVASRMERRAYEA